MEAIEMTIDEGKKIAIEVAGILMIGVLERATL